MREAHAVFERLAERRWLAHVLETEAQIALVQGDARRALELTDEAIAQAEATENAKALASALVTRAKALARLDDVAAAEASFERAAALVRNGGGGTRLRELLTEWASLLAERGEHERAYRLAHEALTARSGARD